MLPCSPSSSQHAVGTRRVPNYGCIGGCAWVRATLTFDGVSKRQAGADSLEVWHHIRGDHWEEKTVNVEGITWHTIVLDPEPFAATKALMSETFALAPEVEAEGMVLFIMPNGTMLELNEPRPPPQTTASTMAASFSASGWTTSRPPRP